MRKSRAKEVGWLDLSNAEVSSKRYWQGLNCQEGWGCGGGGGDEEMETIRNTTLSPSE